MRIARELIMLSVEQIHNQVSVVIGVSFPMLILIKIIYEHRPQLQDNKFMIRTINILCSLGNFHL